MRRSSHNFRTSYFSSVFRRLRPSARCCVVGQVLISATQSHAPDGDIEQSPFTVAEVDLCRRQSPLDACGPTNLLVASLRLERTSYYRFSVSLLVLGRADHSILLVLITSLVDFITTFFLKACFKSLHVNQTFADWFHALP